MNRLWSKRNSTVTPEFLAEQERLCKLFIDGLAKAIKELQLMVAEEEVEEIQDCRATQRLCSWFEHVLMHGLKPKFFTQTFSFWPLAIKISRKQAIDQLSCLQYAHTELGKSRAWIRLAVNECSLESYINVIVQDKQLLHSYYETYGFMRNEELTGAMARLLIGLSQLVIHLQVDTMNLEFDTPLEAMHAPVRKINAATLSSGGKGTRKPDEKPKTPEVNTGTVAAPPPSDQPLSSAELESLLRDAESFSVSSVKKGSIHFPVKPSLPTVEESQPSSASDRALSRRADLPVFASQNVPHEQSPIGDVLLDANQSPFSSNQDVSGQKSSQQSSPTDHVRRVPPSPNEWEVTSSKQAQLEVTGVDGENVKDEHSTASQFSSTDTLPTASHGRGEDGNRKLSTQSNRLPSVEQDPIVWNRSEQGISDSQQQTLSTWMSEEKETIPFGSAQDSNITRKEEDDPADSSLNDVQRSSRLGENVQAKERTLLEKLVVTDGFLPSENVPERRACASEDESGNEGLVEHVESKVQGMKDLENETISGNVKVDVDRSSPVSTPMLEPLDREIPSESIVLTREQLWSDLVVPEGELREQFASKKPENEAHISQSVGFGRTAAAEKKSHSRTPSDSVRDGEGAGVGVGVTGRREEGQTDVSLSGHGMAGKSEQFQAEVLESVASRRNRSKDDTSQSSKLTKSEASNTRKEDALKPKVSPLYDGSVSSSNSRRRRPGSAERSPLDQSRHYSQMLESLTVMLEQGEESDLEDCLYEYDFIELTQALQEDHFSKEPTMSELQDMIGRIKKDILALPDGTPQELRLGLQDRLVRLQVALHWMTEIHSSGIVPVMDHQFARQKKGLVRGVSCDICGGGILGIVRSWYRCQECHVTSHKSCLEFITRKCVYQKAKHSRLILHTCPHQGLTAQHFRCAQCNKAIGIAKPKIPPAKLCDYTGKYFCRDCFHKEPALIPARVVHNWDFSPRGVSCEAFELLQILFTKPLVRISTTNPKLYTYVQDLRDIESLRRDIMLMKVYILTCRDALQNRLLLKLEHYPHFKESADLFSLQDLVLVQKGQLLSAVQSIHRTFTHHIKEECGICFQKGSSCAVCGSSQILFPFDRTVFNCATCLSLFHKGCIGNSPCNYCARKHSPSASSESPTTEGAGQRVESTSDEEGVYS